MSYYRRRSSSGSNNGRRHSRRNSSDSDGGYFDSYRKRSNSRDSSPTAGGRSYGRRRSLSKSKSPSPRRAGYGRRRSSSSDDRRRRRSSRSSDGGRYGAGGRRNTNRLDTNVNNKRYGRGHRRTNSYNNVSRHSDNSSNNSLRVRQQYGQRRSTSRSLSPRPGGPEAKKYAKAKIMVYQNGLLRDRRKICLEKFEIFFSKGKSNDPGFEIFLSEQYHPNWYRALDAISEKCPLAKPVIKLHSTSGREITAIKQLSSGKAYVAVYRQNEEFKKGSYGNVTKQWNNKASVQYKEPAPLNSDESYKFYEFKAQNNNQRGVRRERSNWSADNYSYY